MEKVITNEMTKLLILLGAGVIGLAVVLAKIITKIRGSFKPYRKPTFLYLFVSLLFFAVIALAVHPAIFEKRLTAFIFLQAYFLLLGSIHVYCMRQYLKWSGDNLSFWSELLFTILVGMLGSIGFIVLYDYTVKDDFQFVMIAGILFFLVPFFFYNTFQKAIAVPPKVLKQWHYPVEEEMEEPDDSKMKNLLVISFEFPKQASDNNFTNFRAKAPADMEMGKLFYYFINDYNDRHPNGKIQYLNKSGEPQGWIFYKKPKWYTVMTQYIDADKTIFNNRIRENDVIICTRSLS
jgi:hypothetical protein